MRILKFLHCILMKKNPIYKNVPLLGENRARGRYVVTV